MKNNIDFLIQAVEDEIQGGDKQPDQEKVNYAILRALHEIKSILRTCERDLR